MEKKSYPRLGEEMYHETLENGLNIFMVPKPDFQKNFVFFATKYGGMNTRFSLDGKTWIDSPAGVAHFLEHKLFDTEEGNALQDLASNGASPNAFTSNDITGYYFESTEKFLENLKILLSFVSIPWFTQESVDKEQGIIAQEIGMIEDDPNWRVYMNLLACLYQNHPVRLSVAGTVESISHITAETLYDCHKAFYQPSNMVLVAAGNFDCEELVALAKEVLPKDKTKVTETDFGDNEPETSYQKEMEISMEVSAPLFQLGFKGDGCEEGSAQLRLSMLGHLACEALVGTSSPLYAKMYESGLINQNFNYGYESFLGGSYFAIGGESQDPKQVRQEIEEEAKRLVNDGIDQGLWDRLKKAVYGGEVRGLNSFENICVGQAQAFFEGYHAFDFPQVFDEFDKKDAEKMLLSWIVHDRSALAIIWPKGKE